MNNQEIVGCYHQILLSKDRENQSTTPTVPFQTSPLHLGERKNGTTERSLRSRRRVAQSWQRFEHSVPKNWIENAAVIAVQVRLIDNRR